MGKKKVKNKRRVLANFVLFMLLTILVPGCHSGSMSGTPDNTVYVVQTSPANMLEQLKHGEIDGFIAWEPFNAIAVQQEIGDILIKSEEFWPNHPCCVLAISKEITDPQLVEALAWAHVKASDFINDPSNKEKVIAYAAEFTSQPPDVVRQALDYIEFVDVANEAELQRFEEALRANGLVDENYQGLGYHSREEFWDDFLLDGFILKVKERLKNAPDWQPHPIITTTPLRMGYIMHDLHELAVYVALQEGFYEAVGLTLGQNLVQNHYANGVAVMQAFLNNEIDVAYLGGAPAVLKRLNDDIPIQLIGGANNEGSALVVGRDSGISQMNELAGKVIAVPGIGTVQYVLLQMIAQEAGLTLALK